MKLVIREVIAVKKRVVAYMRDSKEEREKKVEKYSIEIQNIADLIWKDLHCRN